MFLKTHTHILFSFRKKNEQFPMKLGRRKQPHSAVRTKGTQGLVKDWRLGGEGGDRGWDGCMESSTRWT